MSGKGIAITVLMPDDLTYDKERVKEILEDFTVILSRETKRSVGIGVGKQVPNMNTIRRLR